MPPLKRLERQLVAAVVQDKPNVPDAGRILWNCFCELSEARTGNGFGPNAISWADIDAWMHVRHCPLSDSHITIVRAMDRAWLDHAYSKPGDGKTTLRRSSGQNITAAAFDAVFG